WIDERRILVQGWTTGEFYSMDAATGHLEPVKGVWGSVTNADNGGFRLCKCRLSSDGERSFYLMPAENPSAVRPLLYRGRPLHGDPRYVASTPSRGDWLDTLHLRLPSGGLSVDNVHRLVAEGRRANGAPAWMHDLRWTSRDTTVATIDSSGRLRPRRLGNTWIIVSAGGWRVDSALAQITRPTTRTMIRETWNDDWMQRWRIFGDPQPLVVRTGRGPAFLPNGDGSYPSGAYLPEPFSAESGAGLEADLSLRVSHEQWQTLTVELRPVERLGALRRWDHRTGAGPVAGAPTCGISLPGDEGVIGREFLYLQGAGGIKKFRAPRGVYNGGWHRFRFQLLTDGRCALAVDGTPVGILPSPGATMPRALFPQITGDD
ncbi:MAG: hypothetical protein ACYC7F_02720, partial [Gemmatimonadaceae bacterium]